jgi:hypothetical protein
MARPIGKLSNNNALTAAETRSLVAEYSTMTNNDLMKKYNISKTQFKSIVKHYKLKTKYFGKFISGKKDLDFFRGKCGVYAIVRTDCTKVYIGSSTDVYCRFQAHISKLDRSLHDNVDLQNDWGKYGFYLAHVEDCEEKDLLRRENEIMSSLDSWCLYNRTVVDNIQIDYSKIWQRIQAELVISESGCWEYNKASISSQGKTYFAHRISYMYHHGDFSYMVQRKCKNFKCCNPDHLVSVSCKESCKLSTKRMANMSYRVSKLDEFRDAILQMKKDGKTLKEIAVALPCEVHVATLSRFLGRCVGGV